MGSLRSLACIVVALGMVVAFSGCGGGGGCAQGPDLSAPLVGAWQAVGAEIDGEPASVSQTMGLDPSVDNVVCVFWNNGTQTTYACTGDSPVGSESGTWTVSGNIVMISTDGNSVSYECSVSGDQLTMTCVREGRPALVRWHKIQDGAGVGTGGAECGTPVGAMIMGSWEAVSVTANGQTAPISGALDWNPPVDRVVLAFHAYGTLTAYAYFGSNILETRDAMWAASDTTMTIYWLDHIATFDCSVTESELTLGYDSAGNSVVVVWRKVN